MVSNSHRGVKICLHTGMKRSAIIVCPAILNKVLSSPANNLIITSVWKFGATAEPIEQSVNIAMPVLKAVRLPMIYECQIEVIVGSILVTSMSGPHMKDEDAMLTKTTELVAATRDAGTEKDLDISGIAANNAVLDMKADKTIQLDTKTTKLLRHNGRVLVG